MSKITIATSITPVRSIVELTKDFLNDFTPLETLGEGKVLLLYDEKSCAYYMPCHLKTVDFV